jgi:hypothetical protein
MSETAQKRALRNYRSRLTKRGIARFEVLGLDADRDLIRSVARRLAEDGPDSARIRAAIAQGSPHLTSAPGRLHLLSGIDSGATPAASACVGTLCSGNRSRDSLRTGLP